MRRFLLVGVAVLAIACKSSKSSDRAGTAGSAAAGSSADVGSATAGVATDSGDGSAAAGSATDSGDGSAAGAGDGSAAAGSAGAATVVQRPPEVAALEAALVALVNEPEGEARSRKTCGQLMDLQKKARAVARKVPAGVDATAWQEVNDDIAGSLDGIGPYCTDDPPDDSVELPGLYANVLRLLPLLPKAP